jgi:predicted CXXCH cytochrome family protein
MEVLVTFVSTNRRGQAQRHERRIPGPVLTIGRGTQNHIHLPDARVALNHARITLGETEATVERVDGVLEVNGDRTDSARLAVGDLLRIGPYELRVEAPTADAQLALAVTQSERFEVRAGALRRLVLRGPRVSKRRLSYLAFGGVFLLCLIMPLASELLPAQAGTAEPGSPSTMLGELLPAMSSSYLQTWNPGRLSDSHQIFASECRTCHQYPFLQVRDSACVSCHKTIKEHVARADLTGPVGVAFAKTRCAECHRDHKGTQMAPRADELCTACHGDVKVAAPQAASENVSDFAGDGHPAFRLSLIDADSPKVLRRVRQSNPPPAGMIERSNLRFNHRLHIDPAGVRDPENKYTVLKCADCHEPGDAGRLMQPITMERHCQQCHLLAFEPKISKRQVPHGSEEAVMTTLREFYARLVLGDVPPDVSPPPDLPRIRPGAELDYQERQQALRIADERTQRVLRELYETPRTVCLNCHYVNREPQGGWKVAPVRIAKVWMPKARFNHAKHATERCESCHDVSRSIDAADIAMPTIARCRECHVGARPVLGKVTSDCATCHGFHAGRDFWHKDFQTQIQARGAR